jgi:hypothetical protein
MLKEQRKHVCKFLEAFLLGLGRRKRSIKQGNKMDEGKCFRLHLKARKKTN